VRDADVGIKICVMIVAKKKKWLRTLLSSKKGVYVRASRRQSDYKKKEHQLQFNNISCFSNF